MSTSNPRTSLRNILAELYPDEASQRRVAEDTGLNLRQIAFGSTAVNTWRAILAEAEQTNQVEVLLGIALNEYGANPQLQVVSAAYRVFVQRMSTEGSQTDIAQSSLKETNEVEKPEPSQVKPLVQTKLESWWMRLDLNNIFVVILLIFLAIGTRSYWQNFFIKRNSVATQTPSTATQAALVNMPTATPTNTMLPLPTLQAGTTLTNPKDGAVYAWIPPGEFMMGSSITDTLADTDEGPQHRVVLDGFWIMQTEVTNAQYKSCVEAKVCEPPNNVRWSALAYATYPVVNVDWNQAKTYANWVGGHLPTEAEWEKACRGTDSRLFPWGNQLPNERLLNYSLSGKKAPMPVGSYPSGANGLFDMAGNVWEWTADLFSDYDASPPVSNPKGPNSVLVYPLRGGSFVYDEHNARCAARLAGQSQIRINDVGFRVASDGF